MTPGSCITTADCANPDVPLLRCYPEVGQCLCASDYALDGPQCADASPATLGTRVAMGLSVGVIVLLVLTYAPTLYVVIRFRLWRRDAAGVSYVLSWLSIASVLVAASLHLCQTFSADPALASAGRAFFLLSVSLVASTTFLMSATFVDVTQLKKQYTARLTGVLLIALGPFLVVVVLGAVLWLTDREEDWEWTLAVVVMYLVLTVVSIAGPVFLYVRMARNMSRTANRRTPRLSLLCEAMAAEIVYGNRAMRRVLGIYEGSDDSDDLVMFGDSKHDSKGLARADSKRSMRASKDFNGESLDVILNAAKGGAGSVHDVFPAGNSSKLRKFFLGDNNASHTAKTRRKETRFVRFLGRAVRMSFFLALSLLGFAASMLAYHFCAQRVDASLDVRRVALAMAFAQTFLALGVAQLLWFFRRKYKRDPAADMSGAGSKDANEHRLLPRVASRTEFGTREASHGSPKDVRAPTRFASRDDEDDDLATEERVTRFRSREGSRDSQVSVRLEDASNAVSPSDNDQALSVDVEAARDAAPDA